MSFHRIYDSLIEHHQHCNIGCEYLQIMLYFDVVRMTTVKLCFIWQRRQTLFTMSSHGVTYDLAEIPQTSHMISMTTICSHQNKHWISEFQVEEKNNKNWARFSKYFE